MGVEDEMNFFCDLDDALNGNSTTQPPPTNTPIAPPTNTQPPPLNTQPSRRDLCKLGMAERIWQEKLQTTENHKESRKAVIRETKTDIYQLIGFYTVVQGVLFQGVSSMNMERIGSCGKICGFSVALSVLASIAVIGGVSFKLLDLYHSIGELQNAVATSEVLRGLLQKLREEKTEFQWSDVGDGGPSCGRVARDLRREEGESLSIFGFFIIILLIGFSLIFPIAFCEILCSKVEH